MQVKLSNTTDKRLFLLTWVVGAYIESMANRDQLSLVLVYLSPCSTSLASVTIEVLIEKYKVLPVGIRGVARVVTMTSPPPILVRSKDVDHAMTELLTDL